LLGALEKKFWINFCRGVGREDLIERHSGKPLEFEALPGETSLREELSAIFVTADAAEWDRRFIEWDCPGSTVLHVADIIEHPHFAARGLVQGEFGAWPNVANTIRWAHTGERAGVGMSPPPAIDDHRAEVLADWLGQKS
ncbi:MAG: CoA transferase, partial [Caulobacteraceae bacterium]|nr:CoA transferase [Caulobacteraceae bacterium]